jgi:hypothetical protein
VLLELDRAVEAMCQGECVRQPAISVARSSTPNIFMPSGDTAYSSANRSAAIANERTCFRHTAFLLYFELKYEL